MALDDSLLDDPARLAGADGAGLLRSAAMAGAQVRSTVEAAAELELSARLDVGRPRSLVIVSRPGVGHGAARLLEALIAPASPVPVVLSDVVPSWVGALDVVFAHTDDPYDRELALSLERAARYGAGVVLSAPLDGPVASSVAGRGLVLSPRVPVPAELTLPRALAAGLVTANAVGLATVDVDALADRLDYEAERGHPDHESFVNPAKSLALRLADRTPLLWGLDAVAVAVAQHAAYALAAHAAVVADVAHYRQALSRPALRRAATEASAENTIFADPDDPAGEGTPVRVVLLAVITGQAADASRHRAGELLPSADVLAPADEIVADDAGRAAVLALRCELAALYLGLAAGTIGGAGRVAPATA
ncbi:SIS domain-containing protein [Saccharomonospora sp. NB11]|uniref:SIS domain-containing protein n=1 Tax=Saccharomonospora sp. NB11 TaxID=1642298 RepID=UPI0018D0C115|nr:SIS domain-containing protein [Saccharomonospora sp. NB11]